MKLGEIAIIRSGLVLSRKQAQEESEFQYLALNLRSIHPDGYIVLHELDQYTAVEKLSADYITQNGDVVIRLSSPYTAVLIDEAYAGLVVSSNFVIIRANKHFILPEYLHWLLNTPKIKRQIRENADSNVLGSIKSKFYADIDIVPITVDEQRKIAEINVLAKKERQLLTRLTEEKELYYNTLIDQIQKNMRRGIK